MTKYFFANCPNGYIRGRVDSVEGEDIEKRIEQMCDVMEMERPRLIQVGNSSMEIECIEEEE